MFGNFAGGQAYVMDGLWGWIQLGQDSDWSNEHVTVVLISLGGEREVHSHTV